MDFEADMVHQKMKLIPFQVECSTIGWMGVYWKVNKGWKGVGDACMYEVYQDLSLLTTTFIVLICRNLGGSVHCLYISIYSSVADTEKTGG